jgi:hypothetical protein
MTERPGQDGPQRLDSENLVAVSRASGAAVASFAATSPS